MDDIVTRLRHTACYDCEMQSEAADEIERLRKEVNLLLGACEKFAESDPRYEAFNFYFRVVRP